MKFTDPVWGVALMFLGIIVGIIVVNRDLFFKKK